MRKCILIIGPHRSGTSAFSGALHERGVYFGDNLLNASFDNAKGFFENKEIVKLNNQIFQTFNSSWYTTASWPEQWWKMDLLHVLYNEAALLIEREYYGQDLFAIKDPRISLTFPFWEEVLKQSDIEVYPILMIRKPNETVKSLMNRNNFNAEVGSSTTLWHLINAEKYTRDRARSIVDFDSLLNQPKEIFEKLFSEVQILQGNGESQNSFLDSSLVSDSDREHVIHLEIFDTLLEVYGLLNDFKDANIARLDRIRFEFLSSREVSKQRVRSGFFEVLIKSIGPILSNPLSFIINLNFKNFRILFNAIKQENPNTIIRNLKKLLNQK